jgi:glycosyltransferase involved in cell wall biosynthesis
MQNDSSVPRITVMTPTYNRAATISVLAASLEAQTYRDFEWLVVDDGSADDTADVLGRIAAQTSMRMTVIRTPNGGKHRAVNRGVASARGHWFFIVDSDDRLPSDALEKIAAAMPRADSNPRCAGLLGLQRRFEGVINGSRLPEDPCFQTTVQLYFLRGVTGDKAWVHKTAVLAGHPFPEFDGERFLTEAVVWNRIAAEGYTMLLLNEVLYEGEYRADGLSARSLELRVQNPRGAMLYYSEQLQLDLPLRCLVKPALNFMRFVLLSRVDMGPALMNLAKGKALALAMLPAAVALAMRDSIVLRRRV